MKSKEFKDTIHGYISVTEDYCELFIDTSIFQRLKNIEQTSMRWVYPCASHVRFAHSLGVFHLGKKAFASIYSKADDATKKQLDKYRTTFCAACLMHDCGHAPFSHTFEEYYNKKDKALQELIGVTSSEFKIDIEKINPVAHEIVSAYLIVKEYSDALLNERIKGEPEFAARMITGCKYSEDDPTEDVETRNCLIELLNGQAIDVDKLDYILRDTWASGICNIDIDVDRLLSSIELCEYKDHQILVFGKSALSVVHNVLLGRNYLHAWVFSHHTVVYFETRLKRCIPALSAALGLSEFDLTDNLFSLNTFTSTVTICRDPFESVYLPSDGDLRFLFKKYLLEDVNSNAIIKRASSYIPLWKTYAEFHELFQIDPDLYSGLLSQAEFESRKEQIQNTLRATLFSEAEEVIIEVTRDAPLVQKCTPSIKKIDNEHVYMKMDDKIVPITEIGFQFTAKLADASGVPFFYIYIPVISSETRQEEKAKCISAIVACWQGIQGRKVAELQQNDQSK